MACKYIYKGISYTEEQLKKVFDGLNTDSSMEEFTSSLPKRQILKDREQEIVSKHSSGQTFESIANEIGLTKQRIGQIHAQAIRKLNKANGSLFGIDFQNPQQLEFHINTLNHVSNFLEQIGVEQRLVPEFLQQDGSVVEGAVAAANFIEGTVDIIDDLNKRPAAWNKMPEEAAHWWYRLLDQNSELKKSLLTSALTTRKEAEIRNSLYGEAYNGPRVVGKLDINEDGTISSLPALTVYREEAIGQLIAEAIKRVEEKNASPEDYSFLKKFVEWVNSIIKTFKSLYTEQDPFEVAAAKILTSDLSDLMSFEEYDTLYNAASVEAQQDNILNQIQEILPVKTTSQISREYFDYLNTQKFKPRSRFMKKTIEKLQSSINTQTNVLTKEFVEENSKNLDDMRITFFAKFELFNKFKDKIALNSPIKLDGAKKEELHSINFVREKIKDENPNMKSISVTDFVEEVDNYLNQIYSLKTRKFNKWLDYRVGSTFSGQLKDVLHTKIGVYLNNEYFTGGHFGEEPFAWYNITPFNFSNEKTVKLKDVYYQREDGKSGTILVDGKFYASVVRDGFGNFSYTKKSGERVGVDSKQVSSVIEKIREEVNSHVKQLAGYNSFLLHEFQTDFLDKLQTYVSGENQAAYNKNIVVANYLLKKDKYFAALNTDIASGTPYNATFYDQFMHRVAEVASMSTEAHVEKALREMLSAKDTLDTYYSYIRILEGYFKGNPKLITEFANQYFPEKSLQSKNEKSGYGGDKTYMTYLLEDYSKRIHADVISKYDTKIRVSDVLDYMTDAVMSRYNTGHFLAGIQNRGGNKRLQKRLQALQQYKNTQKLNYYKLKASAERVGKIRDMGEKEFEQLYNNLVDSFNNLTSLFMEAKDQTKDRVEFYEKFTKNYLTPLFHHSIQSIRAINKTNGEIRFAGARATLLTQGNAVTAELYAGPEEVENDEAKKLKWLKQVGDSQNGAHSEGLFKHYADLSKATTYKEARLIYQDFKKAWGIQNANKLYSDFLYFSGGKFMEVGPIYTAFSKTKGIKLSYSNTDGLIGATPTYKVDISNYQLSSPILYGIDKSPKEDYGLKVDTVETELIEDNYEGYDMRSDDFKRHQETQEALERLSKMKRVEGKKSVRLVDKETGEAVSYEVHSRLDGNKQPAFMLEELIKNKGGKISLEDSKFKNAGVLAYLDFFIHNKNRNIIVDNMLSGLGIKVMDRLEKLGMVTKTDAKSTGRMKSNSETDYTYTYDRFPYKYNKDFLEPKKEEGQEMLQLPGTESSKASEKTVAKVKEFLKRIGVDIKTAKIDSNGAALLLEDLIKIAEGKEDVALTEEAMHFAVEIIEQTNPKLYKQMLNKIGTYNVYKDIFPIYAKDKEYQIGGSPNVLKIKKEAIGKVLAEYVIKGEEGTTEKPELLAQTLTWWDQIKNFFLSLIGKAGFSPFEEASNLENIKGTTKDLEAPLQSLADRILEKNIPGIYGMVIGKAIKEGRNRAAISVLTQQLEDPQTYPTVVKDYLMGDEQLAKDLLASQETYKQIAPTEEATYDRIINTAKDIEKKESPTKKDENGKPIDSYFYKGKEILKRVTDKAKFYYERLFGNKSISDTEYHKAVKTIMADEGTKGHEDIQHAGHILIKNGEFNPDATLDSSYIPKTNRAIYKVLFDNLKERLSTYPGAKFIQEVSVVDEQKDVAGTIDLLIVKPDGSVQIVDWKFINLNTEKFTDVPWFKQRAWNIQIAEYKRILADRYGIPSHMIKGEAIPIKANYDYPGTVDGSKSLPILKSVEIGNVDVKTEDRDYLLPVTLSGQDTGNKEINKLLSKLNALHTNLENTDVRGTEEKAKKAEQLQFIDKAMRHLAVRNTIGPLINQASVYTKDVQRVIDIFNNSYKDRDFTTSPPSNQELSDYGVQLDNALSQISIYTNLDITLKSLAGTDVSADAHKAHRELVAIVDDARFLEDALKNTINELGEKIANSLGFKNLTNPEPVVTAISRNFNETSKLPTQVLQVMFQKIREANNLSSVTTNEENTELEEIKKDYEKLAASKGLNMKNMFSLVMNYSKNKLIDQFKGEFYTEARAAIKDKREGIKWIVENIDVEKYKKELSEDLEKKIELINSRPWTEEEKKKEIERKRIEYDTSKPDSLGWYLHYYILRNSPIEEKWTSPEWKTLWEKGNEPAQRLYKWVRDINQKAEDVGYLPDDKATRTFLPFVVKSFAEKVIFGGSLTVGEEFIRSMTVDSDTVGYGSIDPLTGKPVLRIPKYFTNKTDKDLSTNLFKNLAIYNQALNKYKYISEVEGIAKVLGRLERNKGSIITNQYGKALFDKETGSHELSEDNSRNTKLFEDQMATLIYGQKYINSEKFDTLLSKVGGTFEKINKTLGVKIMPEGLSERQFSLNKSIDTLNRFFQQKTLGLNPLPALSNLVGGTLQLTINSGKFMNKKELLASQANLASAAVRGEEGKKLLAAMEYFMPFTGNENFRASLHKLSLTRWTENNIQDFLMVLMRSGDKYVQATIFSTLWENAILVDGKIYNAREYVRKETSYKDRYKSNNLEEEEGKFNELVKEVKEKYSLSKQAVIDEKGKLKLPIDRDSSEAFKITNLSQALSKRATGNLTAADVRGINQNIWSNSFMVFKNWIPSLWDARFGKQKYASDVEAYEWGRARTVGRIMLMDGVKSISSLVDLLTFNAFSVSTAGKMVKGTEAGLKSLQELYEYKRQQYFISTGRELNITQDEFFDLVRQNIRNQAKDTLITLSLLAMFFAVKALPPDPDEDPNVINQHKFLVRALDKLSDEVSFYYLPTSFQSMLNGSVMPSVAVLSDGIRVITHGFTELYGDAFDEKIAEKNYFVKYLAKSFPITAQMSSYMPLYAPDLAKELGIQLGTQARR